MDNDDRKPAVLSMRTLVRAETIDGGDTIVLHLQSADAAPIALVMPRQTAHAVRRAIDAELAEAIPQPPPDADV